MSKLQFAEVHLIGGTYEYNSDKLDCFMAAVRSPSANTSYIRVFSGNMEADIPLWVAEELVQLHEDIVESYEQGYNDEAYQDGVDSVDTDEISKEAYDEGFNDGKDEMKYEIDEVSKEKYDEGYNEAVKDLQINTSVIADIVPLIREAVIHIAYMQKNNANLLKSEFDRVDIIAHALDLIKISVELTRDSRDENTLIDKCREKILALKDLAGRTGNKLVFDSVVDDAANMLALVAADRVEQEIKNDSNRG